MGFCDLEKMPYLFLFLLRRLETKLGGDSLSSVIAFQFLLGRLETASLPSLSSFSSRFNSS